MSVLMEDNKPNTYAWCLARFLARGNWGELPSDRYRLLNIRTGDILMGAIL